MLASKGQICGHEGLDITGLALFMPDSEGDSALVISELSVLDSQLKSEVISCPNKPCISSGGRRLLPMLSGRSTSPAHFEIP